MERTGRVRFINARTSNIKLSNVAMPEVKFCMSEELEKFIAFKKSKEICARTESDYRKYFKSLEKYTKSDNVTYESFKLSLQEYMTTKTNKAPATYNVPLSYFNSFCNWAVNISGLLPVNPIKALDLKKKKDEGRVRHIPEEDIRKVLSVISLETFAGFRDYTIIMTTLDTGIRPSELFKLIESNLDTDRNTLTIPAIVAKTRRARTIHITAQTTELLTTLMGARDESWGNYIFYTYDGNKMSIERWEKCLMKHNAKAGTKIAPYDFRHTFAIMFLRNNGNMFALQDIMGHSDINMTKRYLKLSSEDLKNQHDMASPVKTFLQRTTKVRKMMNKK